MYNKKQAQENFHLSRTEIEKLDKFNLIPGKQHVGRPWKISEEIPKLLSLNNLINILTEIIKYKNNPSCAISNNLFDDYSVRWLLYNTSLVDGLCETPTPEYLSTIHLTEKGLSILINKTLGNNSFINVNNPSLISYTIAPSGPQTNLAIISK